MSLPFVSCICPTYGRCPEYQWLLEETVESFVRQDYPVDRRELIIFNDCGQQKLVCDVRGIRTVNLLSRFPSLGAKYNAVIRIAKGEFILPWEDDDLSLPHRISQSVDKILNAGADYWNPKQYLFLPGESDIRTDHSIGVGHNCSIFRKSAWASVGGYAEVSGAQDMIMDTALQRHDDVQSLIGDLPIEESSYIYRWGIQPYHLSGRTPHDAFYKDVGEMKFPAGRFVLSPSWKRPYDELAQEAVRSEEVAVP